ncbi:MAG: hypothetical protein AAGG44_20160 [Planctomycetota bacterium]
MKCYNSPGLPVSPKLMFDAAKLRAKVALRHATWQSYEWAYIAARLTSWAVLAVLLFLFANLIPVVNPFLRGVLTFVAWAVTGPAVCTVIRRSLHGFLARRVFSTRIVAWITSEAIGIQTSTYPGGIVIWRKWKGLTVRGRLSMTNDRQAMQRRQAVNHRPLQDRMHFETARTLRLVLSIDTKNRANADAQSQSMRAIPLSSIDHRVAERLSVVLSAAMALTVDATSKPKRKWGTPKGVDIDAS